MSTEEMKKIENQIYQSILITAGAVGVSMAIRKILKEPLGTPENLRGAMKLTVAVLSSTILVGWMQDKGYVPKAPLKRDSLGLRNCHYGVATSEFQCQQRRWIY